MDTKQQQSEVRYTVRIEYDEYPLNPRTEYSNIARMICFHRRYGLGDDHDFNSEYYSSLDEVVQEVKNEVEGGHLYEDADPDDPHAERYPVTGDKILAIQPLYLMDHSGISISTDSTMFRTVDSVGWDWGTVGFAYVTRKAMLDAGFTGTRLTEAHAAEIIGVEVETYDKYLRGESYGYIVESHTRCTCSLGDEHTHDEIVESCWGFSDLDDAMQEAKAAVGPEIADKLEPEGDLAELAD